MTSKEYGSFLDQIQENGGQDVLVTYHSFCKLIGQTGSSFGSLLVNTKKRPMSLTKRRANDDQ